MTSFVLEGPGGIPGLKQLPSGGTVVTGVNWHFRGNVTVDGTFSAATEVAQVITSSSANAFAVGPNGTTNPSFNIDASASSAATGINLASNAAGSGVVITTLSSGSNENLSISSKGTGTLSLNTGATGNVNFANGTFVSTSGAVIAKSTSANAFAAGANGTTNPVLKVDASTASVATGLSLTGAAAGGGMAVAVISSGSNENLTLNAKGTGTIVIGGTSTGNVFFGASGTAAQITNLGSVIAGNNVAITAGGSTVGFKISSTSTFGIYCGSGVPSISAAQGSLYLRSDGSSSSTRLYVNSDGGTTWVNVTTAS